MHTIETERTRCVWVETYLFPPFFGCSICSLCKARNSKSSSKQWRIESTNTIVGALCLCVWFSLRAISLVRLALIRLYRRFSCVAYTAQPISSCVRRCREFSSSLVSICNGCNAISIRNIIRYNHVPVEVQLTNDSLYVFRPKFLRMTKFYRLSEWDRTVLLTSFYSIFFGCILRLLFRLFGVIRVLYS